MPSILTCLVARQLCGNTKKEDHWSLRDFASQLVGLISTRFGEAYPNLQSRIAKTLLRAFLDPNKPLTTHYGAILGLGVLGREVVRSLLIPNVKAYGQLLQPTLGDRNEQKRMEAERVQGALVQVIGTFLRDEQKSALLVRGSTVGPDDKKAFDVPSSQEELERTFGAFGDKLLPYVSLDM